MQVGIRFLEIEFKGFVGAPTLLPMHSPKIVFVESVAGGVHTEGAQCLSENTDAFWLRVDYINFNILFARQPQHKSLTTLNTITNAQQQRGLCQ